MSFHQVVQKLTTVAVHHEMAARVRAGLLQIHPRDTAKRTAADIGVCLATSQGWLKGRCPSAAHLGVMFKKYGARFTALVLEPCGDWTAGLRVTANIDALEQHLDQLDERAAAARQDLASLKAEIGR